MLAGTLVEGLHHGTPMHEACVTSSAEDACNEINCHWWISHLCLEKLFFKTAFFQ